ncbi:MAG: hypothetical protein FWD63_09315, partial [Propionibacteriaceae bacterium]|nr:hypothetical protein [Propionibacteriaceae bacterium]
DSSTITIIMGGTFTLTSPLLVAILITTGLAIVAAAATARRPRNGADPVLSRWDDMLRRRSLRVTLTTLLGVVAASLTIMSADVLSGTRQSMAYSVMTSSTTPSGGVAWTVSFSSPYGPPFGSGAWALQSNYYNALLAVAVAALLLALIAGAMMDIRPATSRANIPEGPPDEPTEVQATEEAQP